MKQNLNRRSKHLVHVTVGKENYEVKVVMGKYDFHCLETDHTFDLCNGGGDDDDDDVDKRADQVRGIGGLRAGRQIHGQL